MNIGDLSERKIDDDDDDDKGRKRKKLFVRSERVVRGSEVTSEKVLPFLGE